MESSLRCSWSIMACRSGSCDMFMASTDLPLGPATLQDRLPLSKPLAMRRGTFHELGLCLRCPQSDVGARRCEVRVVLEGVGDHTRHGIRLQSPIEREQIA